MQDTGVAPINLEKIPRQSPSQYNDGCSYRNLEALIIKMVKVVIVSKGVLSWKSSRTLWLHYGGQIKSFKSYGFLKLYQRDIYYLFLYIATIICQSIEEFTYKETLQLSSNLLFSYSHPQIH